MKIQEENDESILCVYRYLMLVNSDIRHEYKE